MTEDILTAFQLNQLMMKLSRDIDDAVGEYKLRAEEFAAVKTTSEFAAATAWPMNDKRTVDEKRSLVTIATSKELFAELKAEALRNSADRALKAAMAKLSACQSLAAALREELRFNRVGGGDL